jgi:hypothetical protein
LRPTGRELIARCEFRDRCVSKQMTFRIISSRTVRESGSIIVSQAGAVLKVIVVKMFVKKKEANVVDGF